MLYLIHNDHFGTPNKITDAEQRVVWSMEQTPFGEANWTVQALKLFVPALLVLLTACGGGGGAIIERGSHGALMAKAGIYANLVQQLDNKDTSS